VANFFPPPPPFLGGAQPYAPRTLSPAIPGQSVDPPPFSPRTGALTAALVAAWQPDPWVYDYAGAAHPYGQKKLAPAITAVREDNPPTSLGGPVALKAEIYVRWQPDPWTYTYFNEGEPFAPPVLSPGIPGQSIDNPAFTLVGRTAIAAQLVEVWQPDPWVYDYAGSSHPYGQKKNAPGIPGQSADNPPTSLGGPVALKAEIYVRWQPDPWVYDYAGSSHPYGQKKNAPGIPGQSADPPPATTHPGRTVQAAELVALWQPDPWVYDYAGAAHPYGQKKNVPGIPGQSADPPPFSHFARTAIFGEIVARWQPDPWVYDYAGAAHPYGQKKNAPGIPGQSVDNPPVIAHFGRLPVYAEIVMRWQPPPPDYQTTLYQAKITPQRLRPTSRAYLIV
jgi:hypothetical protein